MRWRMCILTSLATAATLLAQGPTFVVDAANGPGTNYTDLQTAVSLVPSGSTLIVRQGTYPQVTIASKALTVLGGAGVDVSGSFAVQGVGPLQRVTVFGVRVLGSAGIAIDNAAGAVTWDGLLTHASRLVVTNSSQVDVRNLDVSSTPQTGVPSAPPCTVSTNSSVVLEQCTLLGMDLGSLLSGQLPTSALLITQSFVQLVNTSALGGDGGFAWNGSGYVIVAAAPAVRMVNGTLRARGLHPITGGHSVPPAPGIDGSGTAQVDALIQLTALAGSGIALTRPILTRLVAENAAPGGAMLVRRSGPSGTLCVIAASLRSPATSLPGNPDPVWVDTANPVLCAVGIVASSGIFSSSIPVPSPPTLLGTEVIWQAVDFDASGQWALTNPSPSLVR